MCDVLFSQTFWADPHTRAPDEIHLFFQLDLKLQLENNYSKSELWGFSSHPWFGKIRDLASEK